MLKNKRKIPLPSNYYAERETAAREALRYYNPWPIDNNREVAGLIYQRKNGSFGFTGVHPFPGALGEHYSTFPLRDPDVTKYMPEGAKPVADFHTHGAGWSSDSDIITHDERFSNRDKGQSRYAAGSSKPNDIVVPISDWKPDPSWRSYLATPLGRMLEFLPLTGDTKPHGFYPEMRPLPSLENRIEGAA